MLDFMIIGLPRSATTWAANWLCTDRTHCVHDPLDRLHYSEWDEKLSKPGKLSGVSCTSIWRFPDFLASHPARKLILHRDLGEVNKSLALIGMPAIDADSIKRLRAIDGWHLHWSQLFEMNAASNAWYWLTGGVMDGARHAELKLVNMQPEFSRLSVRPDLVRRLVGEARAATRVQAALDAGSILMGG